MSRVKNQVETITGKCPQIYLLKNILNIFSFFATEGITTTFKIRGTGRPRVNPEAVPGSSRKIIILRGLILLDQAILTQPPMDSLKAMVSNKLSSAPILLNSTANMILFRINTKEAEVVKQCTGTKPVHRVIKDRILTAWPITDMANLRMGSTRRHQLVAPGRDTTLKDGIRTNMTSRERLLPGITTLKASCPPLSRQAPSTKTCINLTRLKLTIHPDSSPVPAEPLPAHPCSAPAPPTTVSPPSTTHQAPTTWPPSEQPPPTSRTGTTTKATTAKATAPIIKTITTTTAAQVATTATTSTSPGAAPPTKGDEGPPPNEPPSGSSRRSKRPPADF